MAKEEEKTKEEQRREVALKNLKSSKLIDMATSYMAHKSGAYGEAGNSAMEEFKYLPAFNSNVKAYNEKGEEYSVIQNSILASREDGERYSGNVSEKRIMKSCAAIIQESLNAVTIEDLMKAMGSKAEIKDELKNIYVGDLAHRNISKEQADELSEDEKKAIAQSQDLYKTLVGSYQTYITQKAVSEALSEGAKRIPKNLEKILTEPEGEDKE